MTSNREANNVFSEDKSNKQPDVVKQVIKEKTAVDEVLRVRDSQRDPLGLDIPAEVCPLPSEGKIYPPGHPLHGKNSVEISPMTAREEDILMTRAYLKKGTVMTELLKSCLIDKRIDPDDMVSGDKSAIMVAIRITGYGADYHAEITCPECNEKFDHTFDLSNLDVKPLSMDPRSDYTNEFEFLLPVSKKRVVFKLLTGHDENEMNQLEEKRKKLNLRSGDTSVTSSLFQSIISIDSVTDRAQIKRFIDRMPARDSRALREYMSDNAPNVDMKLGVDCKYCGEHSDVTMPMNASFFWPDIRK